MVTARVTFRAAIRCEVATPLHRLALRATIAATSKARPPIDAPSGALVEGAIAQLLPLFVSELAVGVPLGTQWGFDSHASP